MKYDMKNDKWWTLKKRKLFPEKNYFFLKAQEVIPLCSLRNWGNMGHPVLAGISSNAGVENVSRTMSCLNFLVVSSSMQL